MNGAELGLLLAGVAALVKGVQSAYQKKSVTDTDEFITAWSSRFFGVPILLAAVLFTGVPALQPDYYTVLGVVGGIVAIASVLIAKAYKYTDMSLVDPIYAFSPALLLLTSPLILGESPPLQGVVGVALITLGTYFLKTGEETGVLAPLRNVFRERGVQLMLVVVVLYSVSANLDKIGVNAASPVFWALSVYTLATLLLFPLMRSRSTDWKDTIRISWRPLLMVGVLGAISVIFQFTAISHTLVAYVISIKRLSIPIAVVLGATVFDESNLRGRLLGSLIMVLGAILISTA